MIDLSNEQLIHIRNVPKLLPKRPNGKRVHISAVYRWIQRGICGVRLEVVKIGGSTYTSVEALQRFCKPSHEEHVPTSTPRALTRTRQKQIERAAQEVHAILGPDRTPHRRT